MNEHGRAAVVTGAASGIGLGLARRCAADGMRVVMADVDAEALDAAAADVASGGAEVLAVPTDVSNRESVAELAARTRERFGRTDLLCNNAGVERLAALTETPLEVYEWLIGVNLWGVIHGTHFFLPEMLERDDGYIVNTASGAGLLVGIFGNGAYAATKHAVVALSETLYLELGLRGSKVGVSVLCPGAVRTGIMAAERNWPDRLGVAPDLSDDAVQLRRTISEHMSSPMGMDPSEVAAIVLAHVRDRKFWIHTHPEQLGPPIRTRWLNAADGVNPVIPAIARTEEKLGS